MLHQPVCCNILNQNIDEYHENRRVDRVDDERTDEGDDEECRRRRTEELRHSRHIGDGVRRCAEAKAADA